jgi:glycosyltransferase involved in cell wall biosynthesis
MMNKFKPVNIPMRVLFLETVTRLYGSPRCILELIDYLQEQGLAECWLALPKSIEYQADNHLSKENILQLPLATDHFANSSLFAKAQMIKNSVTWLKRGLSTLKPHIVHTNTYLAWQIASLTKSTVRFPLVAHKRDPVQHKILSNLALHLTDDVISISPVVTSSLPSCYHYKIHTIPDGLPLNLDHLPKVLSRAQLFSKDHPNLSKKESLLIGIVGNLHSIKGQDTVLESAPQIFAQLPDAYILLIGDYYGPKKDIAEFQNRLDRLAKASGHTDRIHFLSFRPAFPDYIANLDLLLVPSRQEGLGRVILEALAYHRPVLATKSGGPEYLASLGAPINLYDINNKEELTSKIVQILHRKENALIKVESHRFLKKHGLISYSGERIMDIYRRLFAKYYGKS